MGKKASIILNYWNFGRCAALDDLGQVGIGGFVIPFNDQFAAYLPISKDENCLFINNTTLLYLHVTPILRFYVI